MKPLAGVEHTNWRRWRVSPGTMLGTESEDMTTSHKTPRVDSVTAALSVAAPDSLRSRLIGGSGFAVRQDENPGDWQFTDVTEVDPDQWVLRYRSADETLEASCTVNVIADHHAAVYQTRITNLSTKVSRPFQELSPIALKVADIDEAAEVMSATGGAMSNGYPARETFFIRRHAVAHGRRIWFPAVETFDVWANIGIRYGRSSNFDLPIIMVKAGIDTGSPGFFIGMEWSATWCMHVAVEPDGSCLELSGGIEIQDLTLDSGEAIDLPAVHIGFFENGFEAGSNACRRYIHQRVIPYYQDGPMLPRVAYTIWPGIDAPYTDADVLPQIDRAAELGVETFIIDAAWYLGDFPKGVGNWEVDREKFPDGLEPISQHIRDKGMGFGLYFDPEYAVPGTLMAREHPEFFYYSPDVPQTPVTGGMNFVDMVAGRTPVARYLYNFSMPAACDYLIEFLGGFIERYQLSYIRWDCNTRDIWATNSGRVLTWRLVDPTGKVQFTYLDGLYRVWETITSKYPNLILENCCGGGRRIDFGTLARTRACWCSDQMNDPHLYQMTQLGGNTFLPGNYLGSSIGPIKGGGARGNLDAGFTDLSFISRLAGGLFFHGRLAEWPPETTERAKHWVTVYKNIRHLLVREYYRLLPQPQSVEDWDACQFCDGAECGIVFVFRWAGNRDRQTLPLRAIDAAATYLFANLSDGKETTVAGKQLVGNGFEVDLGRSSAKLFSYRRVSTG